MSPPFVRRPRHARFRHENDSRHRARGTRTACRPDRACDASGRRRPHTGKAAASKLATLAPDDCSHSSDAAASGRAKRCARTAPLPVKQESSPALLVVVRSGRLKLRRRGMPYATEAVVRSASPGCSRAAAHSLRVTGPAPAVSVGLELGVSRAELIASSSVRRLPLACSASQVAGSLLTRAGARKWSMRRR